MTFTDPFKTDNFSDRLHVIELLLVFIFLNFVCLSNA